MLTWAAGDDRVVLIRDRQDFAELHDLIELTGGLHPGVLVVRFDDDPCHNRTDRAILTAIGNLVTSGIVVTDQIHVLNSWR